MPHNSQSAPAPRGDTGPGILLVLLALVLAGGVAGALVGVVSR
ncbi:hypothetical protein [Micromonospora carbonacea]